MFRLHDPKLSVVGPNLEPQYHARMGGTNRDSAQVPHLQRARQLRFESFVAPVCSSLQLITELTKAIFGIRDRKIDVDFEINFKPLFFGSGAKNRTDLPVR